MKMKAVGHTLGDFGSKMAVIGERGWGVIWKPCHTSPGCNTGTTSSVSSKQKVTRKMSLSVGWQLALACSRVGSSSDWPVQMERSQSLLLNKIHHFRQKSKAYFIDSCWVVATF